MKSPLRMKKMTAIILVIILLIGGIAAGASVIIISTDGETENEDAEICGYIYDAQTGIGLIDEVCVILVKDATMI